jgi:hypothetical protein
MRMRGLNLISKVLEKKLENDNFMMLCFGVAKELGMSLRQLFSEMTQEELIGWSAYFAVVDSRRQKTLEEARRQGGSGVKRPRRRR